MAKRKGGKYAGIVDKLPKLGIMDPKRRDAVQQLKDEIRAPLTEEERTREMNLSGAPINEAREKVYDVLRRLKRTTAGKPHAVEFARAYVNARLLSEEIKQWQHDLGLLLEAYQWLMVDQIENEGESSVRLPSGRLISTFPEPYAVVEDAEKFRLWCIENGYEKDLVLPQGKMTDLVKKRLLAGEPEPDGLSSWSNTVVRMGPE